MIDLRHPGGWGESMRITFVFALAALCSGCASHEVANFQPLAGQQSIVRDGQPALVSRTKNSIVLIRPASRQFVSGSRPVFVVGIFNLSQAPLEFRVADIQATQIVKLVQEERNRQVVAAVLTGVAAGANAYSAAHAGYYNSTSTVSTPHGTYQVNTVGYSPTANAIAQANASAQNEAMISATIEQGQQNLANLEQGVIKDNTMLPGEWYGGQVHLQPLASSDPSSSPKTYSISILVGQDRHVINIVQARVQ
jgi:hypothetical protein